ncbi:unnamed protein product [Schistosoma margrebowiei]|uniref:Uncharacterized protein n=1 Tax=Schistosoma margrebowiei TaxID=48269 RepID=A0A3P8HPC7_9TREM|nr:unnamed protein product [Schistosoma margrebowiei]
MPTELVQVTCQESLKMELDLFLRSKDKILLLFRNFVFYSIITTISRFLPESIGDSLLLDTEAR